MSNVIDMQSMRYINMFRKISHVSTTNCFFYNNIIIFAVPKKLLSKAIGKNGTNMKKIAEIFKKRVRVIPMPKDISGIEEFTKKIVEPILFSKLELKNNTVTITAGNRQNRAALIGRNRVREKELAEILKKAFGISKLKIV